MGNIVPAKMIFVSLTIIGFKCWILAESSLQKSLCRPYFRSTNFWLVMGFTSTHMGLKIGIRSHPRVSKEANWFQKGGIVADSQLHFNVITS